MHSCLMVVCLALWLSKFTTEIPDSSGPDGLFPPPLPMSVRPCSAAAFAFQLLRGELKQRCMTHVAGRNLFLIALIISGDIHPHPGPALGEGIFPCGLCELRCVWDVTQDGGGGAICCVVRGALTRHRHFLVVASQIGFMPTQTTMPPTGIGGRNHAKTTTYHCTIFVISNSLGHNLSIGTMIFAWQVLFHL